ncbi:MAG: chromosomal replication initiator protein DnaA [Candidatus Omnitrophota bacterium]
MNDFELTKTLLEKLLDKPTFEKWILPLDFIGAKNNILFVGSTDREKNDWIRNNLLDKINKHTKKELNLKLQLVSITENDESEEDQPRTSDDGAGEHAPAPEKKKESYYSNLQKKYTFENFVEVDQNRMACSFAHSVADFPGKSYNPLYIYSDAGLGKTHLLNAIGNKILKANKSARVIYCTSSEFMHEYVEYNRRNKRHEFIDKYTSIDVFLIDDIQYITKWESTSEQFYYIFNKLTQSEKQIVLCSDKHPDNIPDLEHRIKTRFEWGGIVDILHYDLESRIAILKTKLEERRHKQKTDFEIPDDVLYFLASSIKDNVRTLEGALNRLIGVANLKFSESHGNSISLAFTKEALKGFITLEKKEITTERIQEYVAKQYNIRADEIISKSNKREIAVPRQIAMFLCNKLINKITLKEIGKEFGDKHHSTVLHSINKVEETIKANSKFSQEIDSILKFFQE